MKRYYTVSKDETIGLWYAHKKGYSNIPVFGSFHKTKKAAQIEAAACMALTYKDYIMLEA
jgi:hypothetical protein